MTECERVTFCQNLFLLPGLCCRDCAAAGAWALPFRYAAAGIGAILLELCRRDSPVGRRRLRQPEGQEAGIAAPEKKISGKF